MALNGAGPGRPKGLPNKATSKAREAIALFVDSNAYRLQDWLDQIAEGIEHPEKKGEYLTNPNPKEAFNLFQSVIEYHIPKLARTENDTKLTGKLEFSWKQPQ